MKWSKVIVRFFFSTAIMVATVSANGQGLKQWFSQKSTQTEYLVQQIAALKMYGGYLKKGYNVVKGGLNAIGDISGGHFNLDRIFIDSLKLVSKSVQGDHRIKEIIQLQMETSRLMQVAMKMVQISKYYYADDRDYIRSVFNKVGVEADRLTTSLEEVLRDGNYQMTDDERIKRIDIIYKEARDQNDFVQTFCSELKKLELQRSREIREVEILKKIK